MADFVISECRRSNVGLDLRLLFDGALADYAAWKTRKHAGHWKDHTIAVIREHVGHLRYSGAPKTQAERVDAERATARRIHAEHPTRKERVAAWMQETGRSERAFDRRLAELR